MERPCCVCATSERLVVDRRWVGARKAEALAIAHNESIEVDAFAAACAGEAFAFVPGKLAGIEWNAHPLLREEFDVWELPIGAHLRFVLVEFGIELFGALLRTFECDDADSFVEVGAELRIEVDEGCCHLAPVAQLQCTLAHAGTGNDGDSVCRAAVDLDEDYGSLAVWVELAVEQCAFAWRANPEATHREHRHANAEDLAGAEMAVRNFGLVKKFVELGDVDRSRSAHTIDATPLIRHPS